MPKTGLTALALLLVVSFLVVPGPTMARDSLWLTDWQQAQQQAQQQEKPILMNFSGSDWCPWCQKLDKEVFSKPVFQDYAEKQFVLFKADFPKHTAQPEALKQQNQKLASQFGVRGLPTVLLVGAQTQVIARTGYRRGGAQAYVAHLKELRQQASSGHATEKKP